METCRVMRTNLVRGVAAGVLCLAIAACGDSGGAPEDAAPPDAAPPDALVVPAFRNPVDGTDEEIGRQALALLGVQVEGAPEPEVSCAKCHAIGPQRLRAWGALTDAAATCLTNFAVTDVAEAEREVQCLKGESGFFEPQQLGIWATAAHLDWFEYLFALAGEPNDSRLDFIGRAGMPQGGHVPFEQPQFDIIAEWFARGLPELDRLMPIGTPPDDCVPSVSAALSDHIDQMATQGWTAVNHDNGMLMFGCASTDDPASCLADKPRDTTWEVPGAGALRRLHEIPYTTDYWSRSSPDGRWVAHGAHGDVLGDDGAAFLDLAADRVIPADAFYDPAFFSDGSGFVFHLGVASVCPTSVLAANPDRVTFREEGCVFTREIGLYEEVGAALGGGDLFALDGQFVNDDGGHDPTLENPIAEFGTRSRVYVTPVINTGASFDVRDADVVSVPFEGDPIMSPSARLAIHRVAGPDARQRGYVIRKIEATATAGGYSVEMPEIGRVCSVPEGGKPSVSYDEQWMVLHHYVTAADAVELGFSSASDPGFAPYLTQGASNLYLVDLRDGTARRLTNMPAGAYALYPHFRSDGWIYFIVREGGAESVHASDAAL